MKTWKMAAVLAASMAVPHYAGATDLEVIHWWTSKGELRAVAEFAKAFDNDGHGDHWVDSAIAVGETARSTIMQRILGGDPPGAAQFNPGRQYEAADQQRPAPAARRPRQGGELGQDHPPARRSRAPAWSTATGIACRSTSTRGTGPGIPTLRSRRPACPTRRNFDEFVADAPKLKAAGFIPFAIGGDGNGWQIKGAFDQILLEALGIQGRDKMYGDKDLGIAGGPAMLKALKNFKALKQYTDAGYANRNWNDTTNLVITGKAALQIMGDWARGEFAAAGMTRRQGLWLHDRAERGQADRDHRWRRDRLPEELRSRDHRGPEASCGAA